MIKGAFNGTPQDAEELLREGGFMIDVHFRKGGTTITLSPQLLGIDVSKNDDLRGFFDNFIENNKVSFLGKNNAKLKKAQSIAKSAHKMKIAMSLDGKSYMTQRILDDYKEFLAKKRDEFFIVRDELVAEYDDAVSDFRHKLEDELLSNTLSKMTWDERQDVIGRIMRRVPSKQKFANSFKVEVGHSKFALSQEVSEDFQADVLDETVGRVYEITGKTLALIFSQLNTVYRAIDKDGKMNVKHRRMISNVADEIERRNIFDNHILENMRQDLMMMDGLDDDTVADMCEVVLSSVYCYADEIDTVEYLDMENAILSVADMELYGRGKYQAPMLVNSMTA